MNPSDRILLAHGGGGRLTQELVRELFLPALSNPALKVLSDSAILPELPPGRPALTTDAFVVDPPVFAGGDLGYPSTVELDDGTLLSVWYEQLKGFPKAVLRQARWRLE